MASSQRTKIYSKVFSQWAKFPCLELNKILEPYLQFPHERPPKIGLLKEGQKGWMKKIAQKGKEKNEILFWQERWNN